jgi:phosphate:Na+ symporter
MFLIRLAAGLALIVFGVRFLRKGLDRLLGGQFIVWLEKATSSRAKSLGAGIVTGVLAPSSTGLSLLTAQVLGNGKAGAEKMLAVLLGANIGMTVLANVAALQVGDYAGLLLFLGVIGFQFAKPERIRGAGQCLLALGFIFLAMNFLNGGATNFSSSRDVNVIFGVLDLHPYVLCFVAALLAVLLQSSTAMVGLGIGLAGGSVLPEWLFMDWIIGTNLGLGFTALLISRTNLEGRRLGLANLIAKMVVAILLMAFVPRNAFVSVPLPLPQQLALMHTAFNVLVALVCLPWLGGLLWAIKRTLVPDPPFAEETPKSFLNPEALETPALALAQATREALRMTDAVKAMLQNLWTAHLQHSAAPVSNIHAQDDAVDEINRHLMLYLSQLGEMNHFDRRWHLTLLHYSSELETAGDIIERNLYPLVAKELAEKLSLDPADEAALEKIYQRTLLQFDLAASFITTRESATAQKVIAAREEINAWCLAQKKIHYGRLKPGDKEALAGSLCFLDMLEGFRRVSGNLSAAAFGLKPAGARPKKSKPGAAVQNRAAETSGQPAPSGDERRPIKENKAYGH